jgi:hypothetical protein
LPFIFTRAASANNITTFEIKDDEDNLIATLDNSLISIINAGAIDYIICTFQPLGVTELVCGHYYYELNFDTEIYYSELFRAIDKDLESSASDIAVNGQFTTDLSGWTVNGATWDAAGAALDSGDSISQTVPGSSFVKIVFSVVLSNTDTILSFGAFRFILEANSTYYLPSGITYTIENTGGATFYVESVEIFEVAHVECYNLIIARNSCNKNGIPYVESGYSDVFIVDAELYEPEYLREDEVDQNGNKDKSQTFMRIDKRWTMQTSNPNGLYEPFVDEINKLPANDCIYIYNDIWKKAFTVFEGTLDIEVQSEWMFEDKCNATVKISITENLVINNACCEVIEGIACCEEFGYEVEETDTDEFTVTLVAPFCSEGVIYSILAMDGDDIVGETFFTGSIVIDISIGDFEYRLKGAKFGCPDIIYNLAVIS